MRPQAPDRLFPHLRERMSAADLAKIAAALKAADVDPVSMAAVLMAAAKPAAPAHTTTTAKPAAPTGSAASAAAKPAAAALVPGSWGMGGKTRHDDRDHREDAKKTPSSSKPAAAAGGKGGSKGSWVSAVKNERGKLLHKIDESDIDESVECSETASTSGDASTTPKAGATGGGSAAAAAPAKVPKKPAAKKPAARTGGAATGGGSAAAPKKATKPANKYVPLITKLLSDSLATPPTYTTDAGEEETFIWATLQDINCNLWELPLPKGMKVEIKGRKCTSVRPFEFRSPFADDGKGFEHGPGAFTYRVSHGSAVAIALAAKLKLNRDDFNPKDEKDIKEMNYALLSAFTSLVNDNKSLGEEIVAWAAEESLLEELEKDDPKSWYGDAHILRARELLEEAGSDGPKPRAVVVNDDGTWLLKFVAGS